MNKQQSGSSNASRLDRWPLNSLRAWLLLCLVLSPLVSLAASLTLPSGFVSEPVGSAWNEPVGLTFARDGRIYLWERGGKVWMIENGVKSSAPFLDLSEEVGGWRDFGLLGFCLDPGFESNGYVYLLYVVDHHHLKYFGTPNYSSSSNEYFMASIGRLTRYTARSSDSFRSVDPASRKILVGETITNGFPLVHQSHGVGSVLFGTDGTLLVSCGDGASYSSADTGSAAETYHEQGLREGIIRTNENVGAYRAQMVDSLSGKVLRLDPETGDGIPNNPWYDAAHPRAPRSRVWALGLRNPCRVTLRPGTGSTNWLDANPGVLYIGDVGWRTWEDLNVCTGPGQDFGWPAFEGLEAQTDYYNANIFNRDAPNPLNGSGGCTQPYFYFHDLIKQDSLTVPSWPNPCDSSKQVPASIPHFVHTRPVIDWKHTTGPARTGIYSGTDAAVINIGAAGSPVSGATFPGSCSIGGVWYTNTDFPVAHRDSYFHADYDEQWIKEFKFDANHRPLSVQNFAGTAGGLVFVTADPLNGGLYSISWTSTVTRIRYQPSNNQAPTAIAAADKLYGPSPLTVQLLGSNSSDPEGAALTYSWNFGDGTTGSLATNPVHTFIAPSGVPTPYTVTLVVTDDVGLKSTNRVRVSINNTPPQVAITSPVDGSKYPLTGDTIYSCTADISDAEHSAAQLSCSWQTILHHQEHEHPEPPDANCATTTVLSPVGCDGETYYYRIILTVSDAAGLSTIKEVRLYPDCQPPAAPAHLTAAAVSSRQINLSWTEKPTRAASFLVERSNNGTSYSSVGTTSSTNYADTLLAPATLYYYRIRATNYGGASPYSTVASARTLAFSGVKINFQPAASPIPPGYEKDDGAIFGNRGNGLFYGWNLDSSTNMVDRNSTASPDQRYDTFARTQQPGGASVWEIAVPQGSYQVMLVSGDPTQVNSVYRYNVEGLLSLSGTPTAAIHWITGSNTVVVTDGRLTVGNATGASNNKLCFLEISAPLDASFRLVSFDRDEAGHVTLRLEGIAGRSYRIDASGDLENWQTLATVLDLDGTIAFDDPASVDWPQRFYRATFTP